MRFTQQDFEGALDFVRDLYDHRGLEDFADRTIGSLLKIVPAERIIYGNFDIERQAAHLSMQPAIVKEQDGTVDGIVNGALSGLERNFAQHPLYRYYLQTGDGRAQKTTQVMTRSQFSAYCESDELPGNSAQNSRWACSLPRARRSSLSSCLPAANAILPNASVR